MPPEQIKRGHVIALFAFDVGYEVDLQLLDTKLLATDLPPTSGKKGVPLHDNARLRGLASCQWRT